MAGPAEPLIASLRRNGRKRRAMAGSNNKKFQKSWQKELPELIRDELCYVIPVKNLNEANQFIHQAIKSIKGV